jgi:hypothetical protein
MFKVTFIFNQGRNGWTETFYWDNPTTGFFFGPTVVVGRLPPNSIPVLEPWYKYAEARVALLSNQAKLDAIRFSDEAVPKSGFLDESVAGLAPPATAHRDVKRRSLHCIIQGGENYCYKRAIHLRGIPDEPAMLTLHGGSNIDALAGKFTTLRDKLFLCVARMKTLVKNLPAGANPTAPIVDLIVPLGEQKIVVKCAAPHGLQDGDQVRISKVRTVDSEFPPDFNHVYSVTRYAGGGLDPNLHFAFVDDSPATSAGFRYICGGNFQKRKYDYFRIASFEMDRFATHRTGAAFFVGAGRSSKK